MKSTFVKDNTPFIEAQIALSEEVYLLCIKTEGQDFKSEDIPQSDRYDFAALIYQPIEGTGISPNISAIKISEKKKASVSNNGRVFIIYCKNSWLKKQSKIHLQDWESLHSSLDNLQSFHDLRIQNLELIEELKRLFFLESLNCVTEIEWAYFTFLVSRSILKKQWSLSQNKAPKNYRAEVIRSAIKYMEMHIEGHPLSVQDIALHCHVSASKLKTLFKAETHCSVYRYYLNMRLDYAAELLAITGLNVSEVAYKIGYSHIGKFSKMFKERHGNLPSHHSKGAKAI